MKYYLGIDGGGTKTKFILCDENGHVITSTNQETCHYLQVDEKTIVERLTKGIDEICKLANINRNDISYAFYGCAGYGDVKKDMEPIRATAAKAFKDIPFSIGNDGDNCLAGATTLKDGINIVCGTGSIGNAYNSKTHEMTSCGGWYHAIGSDECSGYWLAIELLREFTRQADGRDKKTNLYSKVYNHLKLHEDGEVISVCVNDWKMDRTKIASLAGIVEELANEGDPYAIDILKRGAHELFEIIYALYRKMNFKDPIVITYTGGIFNMGDKILKPLEQELNKVNLKLSKPVLTPELGSLLLAFKNSNKKITDEIINNLKEGN